MSTARRFFQSGGVTAAALLIAACTTAAPTSAPATALVAASPAVAAASPAPSAVAPAASSPAASPAASVKPAASPAASAAVLSVVASPSAAARSGAGSLVGTWQWQATQAAGSASVIAADPTRYTINFQSDGSVQIQADCNKVGGTYSVSGSNLTIQLGPSTLVACPPDSQADEFLADLGKVASYSVSGNDLELGLQGGGRMLLTTMVPPQLTGPTWQLLGYNNGRNAVQSVVIGTQPTALFGANGQLSGFGGCNMFSGPYQSTSTTLTIGPLASTQKACEQPVMDQETAYLAALQRTAMYRFDAGRLVLVDSSGATQADFIQ